MVFGQNCPVACSRFATQRARGYWTLGGITDLYRDSCRHGIIASHRFVELWCNRQIVSNQYGLPGHKAASWGSDTIEGSLDPKEVAANRLLQPEEMVNGRFQDNAYYAEEDYNLANIKVPLSQLQTGVAYVSISEVMLRAFFVLVVS